MGHLDGYLFLVCTQIDKLPEPTGNGDKQLAHSIFFLSGLRQA